MQNTLRRKKGRLFPDLRLALLVLLLGLMTATSALAQLAVTGRLTSGEDQKPIPGVNILIKGTNTGTITDADGRYRLSVNSAEDILVFSFVGFVSQEVAVGGRSTI